MNIDTQVIVKTVLMFAEILKKGAREAAEKKVIEIAEDICQIVEDEDAVTDPNNRRSAVLTFTKEERDHSKEERAECSPRGRH